MRKGLQVFLGKTEKMETVQKKPFGTCYSTKEKMGNLWEFSGGKTEKLKRSGKNQSYDNCFPSIGSNHVNR